MDQDRPDPFAPGDDTTRMSAPPPQPRSPRDWWPPSRDNWWITAGAGAALVLVVVVLAFALGGDGDPPLTATTGAGGPLGTTTTIVPDGTTPPDTDPGPGASTPIDVFGGFQPIAVKIDNVAAARPQVGIDAAEIVFEVPVEGGLTRLTAIYLSARPTVVGPVRSLRPVDADLLAAFEPVLVSTGGQDFVRREVAAAGIVDVSIDDAPDLFQVLERPAPHNLVASIPLIANFATAGPPRTTPFPFGSGDLSGESHESVGIPFSAVNDVTWTWNGTRYVRSVNGEPFLVYADVNSNPEPLETDTVLVLQVAQRSAGYTDGAGADVPTFDVIGFGRFFLFHGGVAVDGEWRRAAQEDGYRLISRDGTSLRIPAGRLFVEIVPRFVDVGID